MTPRSRAAFLFPDEYTGMPLVTVHDSSLKMYRYLMTGDA